MPENPRYFIAGSAGQLGTALLGRLGDQAFGQDIDTLDVADPGPVAEALDRHRPEVVINAAAFTHVDRCEREPELAERANAVAPGVLAEACAARGLRFVHVSTDYVFPGDADRPYAEDDPPGPVSAYGRTKLDGERRVHAVDPDFLVVRTSWVYGRGRNFPAAILAQALAGKPIQVVDDQLGCPTWARDLADGLLGLLSAQGRGLYHLVGGGTASWWDLARAVLDATGHADVAIARIGTGDLDLDAPRPAYSVLGCERARQLGVVMRPWREALEDYLGSDEAPEGAGSGR